MLVAGLLKSEVSEYLVYFISPLKKHVLLAFESTVVVELNIQPLTIVWPSAALYS